MSVEQRLERLESREEIKELRAEYCYCVDDTDGEAFAALFTEDATLDFGSAGTYTGHEELREFVDSVVPEHYEFIVHMVHNPVIDVDGDTATGRWYFEAPCTSGGTDMWIQGVYDEAYERVDGAWRFADVEATFNYVAEYDEGWGEA
ncbi:MAG: nuclear transport factor 2 family protein [Halorientalis sp.]